MVSDTYAILRSPDLFHQLIATTTISAVFAFGVTQGQIEAQTSAFFNFIRRTVFYLFFVLLIAKLDAHYH